MGPGSHVGFPISAKNKNLVYDHPMNISAKFDSNYGPWQPCWISNRHQKHKSGRGPSSEHFWQVWLISVQRFQRRRFKCEKLTDGRTDAYPWQKLTWPMARWAKNSGSSLFKYKVLKEPENVPFIVSSCHLYTGLNCIHYSLMGKMRLPLDRQWFVIHI